MLSGKARAALDAGAIMPIRPEFFAVWSRAREHRCEKACSRNLLRLGALVLFLPICGFTRDGHTQQAAALSASDKSLPDAPGLRPSSEPAESEVFNPQSHSSISGTVLDANGGTVSGARVTLTLAEGAGERVVLADSDGKFAFGELQIGRAHV